MREQKNLKKTNAMELDKLVEKLRGDSISDFYSALDRLCEIASNSDPIEDELLDVAKTRGGMGREAFISWLSHRGTWKQKFSPIVLDALSDTQAFVRADAIGIVAREAPRSVLNLCELLDGNIQVADLDETPAVFASLLNLAVKRSDHGDWMYSEVVLIRRLRAALLASLIATRAPKSEVEAVCAQEDSMTLPYLANRFGFELPER